MIGTHAAQAQTTMWSFLLSSGGATMGDSSHVSVGQPLVQVPVGNATSTNYRGEFGLWFTVDYFNDSPSISTNSTLTLNEAATATVTNSFLKAFDVDNSTSQLTFTLTTPPPRGELKLNGTALATSGTFTQANIDASQVTYVHDAGETTSDQLSFTLADGAGGTVGSTNFNFTVTAQNDSPAAGFGFALDFDGTDDYADAGTDASLDLANEMTLEAWVKPGSSSGTQVIAGKVVNTGATSQQFGLMAVSGSFAGIVGNGTSAQTLTADGAFSTGTWYHVALTRDSGGNMRLYIDGAVQSSTPSVTGSMNPGSNFYLGRLQGSNTNNFQGSLDDVRVWSAALSSTNIGDWKGRGVTSSHPDYSSLVSYWVANEGGGTSVADSKGSNNITLNNMSVADWVSSGVAITYPVSEGTALSGHLFGSDAEGNSLTYAVVSNGSKGTAAVTTASTGAFTYTPSGDNNGSDSFTYKITDSNAAESSTVTANLNISAVNDAPVLATNATLTLNEAATATVTNSFLNVTDVDNTAAQTTFTVGTAPTNGTLLKSGLSTLSAGSTFTQDDIDNSLITYVHGGSETTSDSFTFTVADGSGGSIASTTFNLTVTAVNDAPVAGGAGGSFSYTENDAATVIDNAITLSDTDNANLTGATVTLSANYSSAEDALGFSAQNGISVASNSGGVLTLSGTATVAQYQTALRTVTYANGSEDPSTSTRTVSIVASDGTANSNTVTRDIAIVSVNDVPTITTLGDYTIDEDAGTQSIGLAGISTGGESQTLSIGVASSNTSVVPTPALSYTSPNATGALSFTPPDNAYGESTITLTLTDNGGTDNGGVSQMTTSFKVIVNSVNDTPTLGVTSALSIEEDQQTTIGLEIGDVETDAGSLIVSAEGAAGATVGAALTLGGSGANRTLTIKPDADDSGSMSINVTVSDGELSVSKPLSLTVSAVNDVPTIGVPDDLSFDEDGSITVSFSVGDADSGAGSLSLSASADNADLISSVAIGGSGGNRTLTLVGAPDATGGTWIRLSASDGEASGAGSFFATVNPVNDAPVLGAIGGLTIAEDSEGGSVSFAVSDVDEDAGRLTVTATASDPALLSSVTVGGSGGDRSVHVQSAPDQSGTASVAVTVRDEFGLEASGSFMVMVEDINDVPTISGIGDVEIDEDATANIGFSVADIETAAGELGIEILSSNPGLVPAGNVAIGGSGGDRSLSITPREEMAGSTTITVKVSDGSGGEASSSFGLTVHEVSDPPTIGPPGDIALDEDGGAGSAGFTVDDGETLAGQLEVAVSSSNEELLPTGNIALGGAGGNRTISVTPAENQSGTATVTLTVTDESGLQASGSFTVNVSEINDLPEISAIGDQQGEEGSGIGGVAFAVADVETAAGDLRIAVSSSNQELLPDGNISVGGSGADRSLSLEPAVDAFGAATVTVAVSDGQGGQATTSFGVEFVGVNDLPTLAGLGDVQAEEDAGGITVGFAVDDVETPAGELAVSVSSSNPELLPAGNISLGGSDGARTLELAPLPNAHGETTIGVTVSDADGGSVSGSLTLVVDPINDPPVFTSEAPSRGLSGELFEYRLTASDEDGDGLSLAATTLPGWLSFVDNGDGTGVLSGTPTRDELPEHAVAITLTDGIESVEQTFTVVLSGLNTAPFFTSDPVGDAVQGEAYSYTATTADEDGDPVAIAVTGLPGWLGFNDNGDGTATLSGTPANADVGAFEIQLSVDDGLATEAQVLNVVVVNVNDAPVFLSEPVVRAVDGVPYNYDISVEDLDGDAISVAADGLPRWLSLVDNGDGTALLSGEPTFGDLGSFEIVLTAGDGGLATQQIFTIEVPNVNTAPVFIGDPVVAAVQDEEYRYEIATSDADGHPLNLTVADLPGWMAFADNGDGTGVLSGTPTNDDVGEFALALILTDGREEVQLAFAVVVVDANDPPVFTSEPVVAAVQGVEYAYGLAAEDVDGDPLALSGAGLPGWLALTDHGDGTGILQGTPTNDDVGEIAITVGVSDGIIAAEQVFTLTIADVNDLPLFVSEPLVEGFQDAAYAYEVLAEDIDGDALVLAANLPEWLALTDNGDGSGLLSGTPTNADVGLVEVALTVSDGVGESSQTFVIDVMNVNDPPLFVSEPITESAEDAEYSYTASGLDLDEEALTLEASGLPAWLAFADHGDGTATLSGVPANEDVGEYIIDLILRDSQFEAVQTFTVVVVNVNDEPVFASEPLTSGVQDAVYAYQVAVTDEDGDALALAASGLPEWLSFTPGEDGSGALSGTPLNADVGIHEIVLTASDGTAEVTQAFAIEVLNVNDPPVLAALADQTLIEDQPLALPISAEDIDGDELVYAIEGGGPETVSAAIAEGVLTLTPALDFSSEVPLAFRLQVDDGLGGSDAVDFGVLVTEVNDPPEFVGLPADQTVNEDETLELNFAVVDVDHAEVTLSLAGAPENMLLNETTLSFAPDFTQAGAYPLVVTASDGVDEVQVELTLTVANVNRPPVFTAELPEAVLELGDEFTFTYAAEDPDGEELAFALITESEFALIDPVAGVLSFSAVVEALGLEHALTVSVSDGASAVLSELLIAVEDNTPTTWEFAEIPETVPTVAVTLPADALALVGDTPLEAGDGVAVQFAGPNGLETIGYSLYFPGEDLSIEVRADDPDTPEKEGFAPGEELQFRIWKSQDEIEHATTLPIRLDGNATFSADGGIVLHSLVGLEPETFAYALPEGWSIISNFVLPEPLSIADLFRDFEAEIEAVKDGGSNIWWPEFEIDEIGEWDYQAGYWVKLRAPIEIEVAGFGTVPQAMPLQLRRGWNTVSYIRKASMRVEEALSGIEGQLEFVKTGDGLAFWPAEGINSLEILEPGRGYKFYMNEDALLTYPPNNQAAGKIAQRMKVLARPQHYAVRHERTGSSALVAVEGPGLREGDEIGVWNEAGQLVGGAVVQDGRGLATVWGDDGLTKEIEEGAIPGELLSLTLYSPLSEQEEPIYLKAMRASLRKREELGLRYRTDAVWRIEVSEHAKLADLALPEAYGLGAAYPNPFNPETTIPYQLPEAGRVQLVLFNALGQLDRVLLDEEFAAGFYKMDFVADDLASGVYFYRLTIEDKFTAVGKMIYLR